jgi:hypothetical protein
MVVPVEAVESRELKLKIVWQKTTAPHTNYEHRENALNI